MFFASNHIDKTGIQRPVAARNQALTTPGSLAPQILPPALNKTLSVALLT